MEEIIIEKVQIKESEVAKFSTRHEFMELGFELTKEIMQFLVMVCGLTKVKENNKTGLLQINEAIILGLMIRLMKLYQSFLENIMNQRQEMVSIVSRCILETEINILYLLKDKSDETFKDFIAYSLSVEKKLLNEITKNVKDRGFELNIEKRMKLSIENTCLVSGFDINNIPSQKDTKWKKKNLLERFKDINIEGFYTLYSILCHSAHGNWQDILFYNLEVEGEFFRANYDWMHPDLRAVLPINLVTVDVCKQYLIYFDSSFAKYTDDIIDMASRIRKLLDLYEKFIVKYQVTEAI